MHQKNVGTFNSTMHMLIQVGCEYPFYLEPLPILKFLFSHWQNWKYHFKKVQPK